MGKEAGITPESAEEFRITLESSSRASEVARIMEGPANPTNPRYDNFDVGPIKYIVLRGEKGQPLEMEREVFNEAVDAAETFVEARKNEQEAKDMKDNAAAYLVGIARRVKNFRGVGFPKDNDSATIVPVKSKKIPDENIAEVVDQAGLELHEFGTEQVQLTVNVPVSLTDRKGNSITTEVLEKKLSGYLSRMLRPEDKGLVKIARKLKINDWKKLAELVRQGKVSHDLVEADEEYIVKPIALSQVRKSKTSSPKNIRRW